MNPFSGNSLINPSQQQSHRHDRHWLESELPWCICKIAKFKLVLRNNPQLKFPRFVINHYIGKFKWLVQYKNRVLQQVMSQTGFVCTKLCLAAFNSLVQAPDGSLWSRRGRRDSLLLLLLLNSLTQLFEIHFSLDSIWNEHVNVCLITNSLIIKYFLIISLCKNINAVSLCFFVTDPGWDWGCHLSLQSSPALAPVQG